MALTDDDHRRMETRNAHALRSLHLAHTNSGGREVCLWCQQVWPCEDTRWAIAVLENDC